MNTIKCNFSRNLSVSILPPDGACFANITRTPVEAISGGNQDKIAGLVFRRRCPEGHKKVVF